MMQLNIMTDYAIRVILYLSMKEGIFSSNEIAQKMKIPHSCVQKVTVKLSKAGLISTHVGKQGGFCLIKKPSEISLLDIIMVMETTVKINKCLENDGNCSRGAIDVCQIHDFYKEFQAEMEQKLSAIKISNLIDKGIT